MQTGACPACQKSAAFATLKSECRIYGHECARYDGIMMYWYAGCPTLFVSLSHAQSTRRHDALQAPEWLAEVIELIRPVSSRSDAL